MLNFRGVARRQWPVIVVSAAVALAVVWAAMLYVGPTYHTTMAVQVTSDVAQIQGAGTLQSELASAVPVPTVVANAFQAYTTTAPFLQGVQQLGGAFSGMTAVQLAKVLGLAFGNSVVTISADGRTGADAANLAQYAAQQLQTFTTSFVAQSVSKAMTDLQDTLSVSVDGLKQAISSDQARLASAGFTFNSSSGSPSAAINTQLILRLDPAFQGALSALGTDESALSHDEGDLVALQSTAAAALATGRYGVNVQVIGQPVQPNKPIGPRRKMDSLLGLILGAAVGVVWAVARESAGDRGRHGG